MRRLGDRLSRRGARPLGWYLPREIISYLLRDEFTTPLAAGSVNGTAAEPGPGTRVVVDTANGVTITGGNLSLTGFTGLNDPGYWLDGIARVAGRLLKQQFNRTAIRRSRVGWDSAQGGSIRENSFRFNVGGVLSIFTATSQIIGVATWVANTDYECVVVLRTAGAYHFIKGGAFTNWTLLWVTDVAANDPLYPGIGKETGAEALLSDFCRVPDVIWLPTPLAYDTFTRANGALGNSETTGPDAQDVTARAWANRIGTTLVAANAASASALVGGEALATVDTVTADVLCDAELTRAGGNVGIVVRYQDATNYIIAYHTGVNARLDKIVAGVTTNVISAAAAYGAGRVGRVICEGTQFQLFYNDVKIGATSTINDASLQAGTEQGLYSTNVGNSQDDFEVFPRGSGNEYARLDDF